MQVLVMGCGRVGALVATHLLEAGHEVRVIDVNPESFLRIPPDYREQVGIEGDGTREDDLKRGGIESADAFMAVSSKDSTNILAAQIARHLFNVPKVICRVNDLARQEMYEGLGLRTVSPIKYLTQNILKALEL